MIKAFLGVDGGGTQTRAVLIDSGGRVFSGCSSSASNYHHVGLSGAVGSIVQAATRALELSPGTSLGTAFVGCAGIKARRDAVALHEALAREEIFAGVDFTVENDLHNALSGGLAGRHGIALIAGTGSNCLGRDQAGHHFMCGGWGWMVDDRGAGFGLSRDAIYHAARAADGRGPQTVLLPEVLEFLGISEPDELLARLYVDLLTPGQIAAFAPIVMRCAAEGDEVAAGIMRDGADALAELVAATERALDFPEPPDVVFLGGCLTHSPTYARQVAEAVRLLVPGASLREAIYPTDLGAGINALRAAGIDPIPDLIHKKSC